jgi:hypothetical protein
MSTFALRRISFKAVLEEIPVKTFLFKPSLSLLIILFCKQISNDHA